MGTWTPAMSTVAGCSILGVASMASGGLLGSLDAVIFGYSLLAGCTGRGAELEIDLEH